MSQRTYDPATHRIGHRGALGYCDTVDGDYIRVRGTQECNIPESELGESETTNDDSTDFHKEYIPGVFEPGNVTFTYVFQADQFSDIDVLRLLGSSLGTRASGTKFWRHFLPDGSKYQFRGWVKSNKLPRDQEGTIVCEAEIKVIGKTTFTPDPTPGDDAGGGNEMGESIES